MESCCLILVFLVTGLWEIEAVSVTGVVNGKVKVECSHSYASSNVKYFCKGDCSDEDILISSREKKTHSQDRYSIEDKGNTFYVTISSLTQKDSGTYWCGIDRVGADTYNKVILTVTECSSDNDQQANSVRLIYVGAGLGVTVLTLAVVLLMFFRYRKNRSISATSGKDHSTVNTTVQNKYTNRRQLGNNHFNVTGSPEDENQPGGVVYTTVSFNQHTDRSTVTPPSTEVTYSTITHKSKDESVVYGNA